VTYKEAIDMSTVVTTASLRAVSDTPTERADGRKFGGIAAIAAAVVVISPVIVFGLVMPAFGLSTREAYATPAVIQDKWPLMMVASPLVLLFGFLIVLVTLAMYELLAGARSYRNAMRLSLGLAFMGCLSYTFEAVRNVVASLPNVQFAGTADTQQYEFVMRLMFNTLEPVFLYTGVILFALSAALWGFVALKSRGLSKALSIYAIVAGIGGAILSPLFNFLFVILYLWLGVTLLRSTRTEKL
jgi:hypothetical protein